MRKLTFRQVSQGYLAQQLLRSHFKNKRYTVISYRKYTYISGWDN